MKQELFLTFTIEITHEKNIHCITNQRKVDTCQSLDLFIYLGFCVAFHTVQVISRWVVGRAGETSTYSLSGFCTVNCRPTASNYQLSHLGPCWELNPARLCHCGPLSILRNKKKVQLIVTF